MNQPSRFYKKVLKLYKQLYITRNQTFQDDTPRLESSLTRLRNEFRVNKNETDETKIKELIKTGREVDQILRNNILQTLPSETKPNVFSNYYQH